MLAAIAADADVRAKLGDPLRFEAAGAPRPAGGVGVEASDHWVDFAVVSRVLDGREAMAGMHAVRAALEGAELVMDGWRCVLLLPVYLDATRTRPGLWRALLRVKAVVERV